MASVNRESIGNLHEKLTVTLEKTDYLPVFEKEVKSLSKRANIPGFRKGMVPAGMIKKMYGKELYTETVLKSAENELKNYLIDEKVDIFGQPLFLNDDESLPKMDMQQPEDYKFSFEIGLRPQVEINIPADAEATFYKVAVKPEDIEQRIESFQDQFGDLKEAEVVEGPDNVISVTISETDDEGKIKEDGFVDDTSLYVKVFTDDFQAQLQGKKKDDVLTGTLDKIIDPEKYPVIYERLKLDPKNAEEASSPVEVKITSVNTLDRAALDEEFFKKAFPSQEIKTEEEFREAVKADEQKYWDEAATNYLDHTLHHILSEIPVSLPADFLKKMLNDPEKPEPEEAIEERYPAFEQQMKWSLISEKIIEENDIKVELEELKEDIGNELRQYLSGANFPDSNDGWMDDYINRMLQDQKATQQRAEKLLTKKVFEWARKAIPVNEKEVSQEEFSKIIEEHNHKHNEEHHH